jgi:signal transduction histidine kinase
MFKRIFFGYLVVLIFSFAVLALAFSLTVRYYLINDTIASLQRVAETLSSSAARQGMPGGGHMRGAFFSLANRIAYADYLVLQSDGIILDSSDYNLYPPGSLINDEPYMNLAFKTDYSPSLIDNDNVAVAYPLNISGQTETAALILYSRLDLLSQLNRALLGLMALSLVAGIMASLIIGAFATRVVVGPLQQLKIRALALSKRRFDGKLSINTGDELEELAEAFNEMSDRLATYDLAQKYFFQKASHELKTPLMSIQGYAEALKDGIIPPGEYDQALGIVIRESGRMKNLVEQFIMLSRMETIMDDYAAEPVDLEETIREAISAIKSLALEKDISIETDFSGNDQNIILGDPEKIHRLLLNIFSNALRYAKKKISVTVNSTSIEISDDGIGFMPADLPHIFEPFYRGNKGGNGLGLAISRAIVEKHGGSITAANSPGGGAMINILFPSGKQ